MTTVARVTEQVFVAPSGLPDREATAVAAPPQSVDTARVQRAVTVEQAEAVQRVQRGDTATDLVRLADDDHAALLSAVEAGRLGAIGDTINVILLRAIVGFGDAGTVLSVVETASIDGLIAGGYIALYTGPTPPSQLDTAVSTAAQSLTNSQQDQAAANIAHGLRVQLDPIYVAQPTDGSTPSSTTFLRGDGTWAPAAGGVTDVSY